MGREWPKWLEQLGWREKREGPRVSRPHSKSRLLPKFICTVESLGEEGAWQAGCFGQGWTAAACSCEDQSEARSRPVLTCVALGNLGLAEVLVLLCKVAPRTFACRMVLPWQVLDGTQRAGISLGPWPHRHLFCDLLSAYG